MAGSASQPFASAFPLLLLRPQRPQLAPPLQHHPQQATRDQSNRSESTTALLLQQTNCRWRRDGSSVWTSRQGSPTTGNRPPTKRLGTDLRGESGLACVTDVLTRDTFLLSHAPLDYCNICAELDAYLPAHPMRGSLTHTLTTAGAHIVNQQKHIIAIKRKYGLSSSLCDALNNATLYPLFFARVRCQHTQVNCTLLQRLI